MTKTINQTLQKVVLTGGPCAGKTTALPLVRTELERRGYTVAMVPEVAGLLLAGGYRLRQAAANWDTEAYLAMQIELCRVQQALEDAHQESLRTTCQHGVILCDRGMLDNQAYLLPAQWQAVLNEFGWSNVSLAKAYDVVYHLVSAADGAPDFYKAEGVRSERLSDALLLEDKTDAAWAAHPRRRVIANEDPDFQSKMARLLAAVRADFPEV